MLYLLVVVILHVLMRFHCLFQLFVVLFVHHNLVRVQISVLSSLKVPLCCFDLLLFSQIFILLPRELVKEIINLVLDLKKLYLKVHY